MSGAYTPARSAYSRVFIIEGRARADHAPEFQSCLKAGPIEQGFGDVTKIECPSSTRYGEFDEVGEIQEAEERPTTNLVGNYAADLASDLLRIAKKRCDVDVQFHFGACTDPANFNLFTKAVIFEKAKITNYATDDLGALASDENAKVTETGDMSGREVYEVLPLTASEKAKDTVTNELVDVVICDQAGCGGDCNDESNGCEKIYSISVAAGGSPGTPADVVFSIDGGATWYAHDVDTLLATEDGSGIACLGSYLVVVSNESCSLHYAPKADVVPTDDPAWTEVSTGFVAAKCPNDIWSIGNSAFIVGDGGYVYFCEDPTAGVSVLDAGVATVDNLLAVHAISDTFAVAVGNNGAVIYTDNGTSWQSANPPVGVAINLNCVWVKSEDEWWVGTSTGRLYYTLDRGVTWTQKAFSGSGTGQVRDIAFSTDSVGYMAHSTAAPAGRILRTYDGGNSWVIIPEGTAVMPTNDYVGALAACTEDPNFVVGVGLAGNATDGFVVVAQD